MVKWTAHAKSQVRHIYNHIAQDSPLYARRVSEELVKKTIGLDELPRRGKKVPELNVDAVRELSRAAKERLLKFQQIRGNGSSSSSSSMR